MKVAFFTGHTSRKIGGIEEFLLQLNRELGEGLLVLENNVNEISERVAERFREEGLNLSGSMLSRKVLPTIGEVYSVLRKTKPSAVHVNFSPVSYITIIMARLLGVRNIFWTKHSMLSIGKYSSTWWYHKICGTFVKKIICISQAINDELGALDLGDGKRLTLPLGINLDRFEASKIAEDDKQRLRGELGLNAEDIVISVVAQIRAVKRLDVLIDAVNILVGEFGMKRIRALIVGGTFVDEESRSLEAGYRRTIEKNGLSDHIRLLGVRNDIPLIYSISTLSGLTSSSEGLGLSLVEAAAMGLPLFGSNTGGIPEVVRQGQNGFLFDVGDYRQLARGLRDLLADEERLRRYGKNSRELARRLYDAGTNVRKLKELYVQER